MGWSVGFDSSWKRDVGYGVPSLCDHPGCGRRIDRGLSYVCGADVYGGEHGCGLFFCGEHLGFVEGHGNPICARCRQENEELFEPTKDLREWVEWKLEDESWAPWRADNPEEVRSMKVGLDLGLYPEGPSEEE